MCNCDLIDWEKLDGGYKLKISQCLHEVYKKLNTSLDETFEYIEVCPNYRDFKNNRVIFNILVIDSNNNRYTSCLHYDFIYESKEDALCDLVDTIKTFKHKQQTNKQTNKDSIDR